MNKQKSFKVSLQEIHYIYDDAGHICNIIIDDPIPLGAKMNKPILDKEQ